MGGVQFVKKFKNLWTSQENMDLLVGPFIIHTWTVHQLTAFHVILIDFSSSRSPLPLFRYSIPIWRLDLSFYRLPLQTFFLCVEDNDV